MSTTSIDQVVQEIDGQVMKLGTLVERALVQALEALQSGDEKKAGTVVVDDTAIDQLHLSIEEHALVTLVMHQPQPGRQIRYLTSVQPIAVDLERMGDEAEAMAQILMRIIPLRMAKPLENADGSAMGREERFTEFALFQRLVDLGWKTRSMLQRTMKAFAGRDAQAARAIWEEDHMMDRHHYAMRRDLLVMLEGSSAEMLRCIPHDTFEPIFHAIPIVVCLEQEVQVVGGSLQPFAELGSGNGNQPAHALGEVEAMQGGNAIFGHDVVDVRSRGGDRRAAIEDGNNARDGAIDGFEYSAGVRADLTRDVGGGWQSNDGSPTFGEGGSTHKIGLTADAAIQLRADGFRADLSGQVDLDGAIDGHHVFETGE